MSAAILSLLDSAIEFVEEAPQVSLGRNQTFVKLETKTKTQTNVSLMPVCGLGTWKSKDRRVFRAVEYAINLGIRHIDTAAGYGNEREIGKALRNKLNTVIKREDLFIVSKLWNSKHHPDDVVPALKQSLADLGLEYLDLYLIHWPITFLKKNPDNSVNYGPVIPIVDTWLAMEKCVELGLCKHIGLSNFNSEQITEIMAKGSIKPAVLQCENHPYLTTEKLVDFCRQRGIVYTAYSALGSGDRPWGKPEDPRVLDDPTLEKIAQSKGKSVAQVCIRFQIERGNVVIPKSTTPSRIKSNFDVWNFKLSEEEMKAIFALNRDWRSSLVPDPKEPLKNGKVNPRDRIHPNWPFHIPF